MRAAAVGAFVAMLGATAPAAAQSRGLVLDADTERSAVRTEREASIACWAIGGILFTTGGFETLGIAFPQPPDGLLTIVGTSIAAGGAGFVLLIAAAVLSSDAHRRRDRLRDAGLPVLGGAGDAGLSLALAF
jgi:hypothetical protein